MLCRCSGLARGSHAYMCATGVLIERRVRLGFNATPLDPSARARRQARGENAARGGRVEGGRWREEGCRFKRGLIVKDDLTGSCRCAVCACCGAHCSRRRDVTVSKFWF